jgi:ketosteroid isomerase-like protein
LSEESTTHDLLEELRRSLEAINRRDWDAAMAVYRPDAVWDNSAGGLGIFEGRDAIRGFIEDWWAAYEDFEQRLERFCDLGSGVTFGVVLARARLPGTGGFIELRYAAVATWGDGLIRRNTLYTDLDQARAAAERLAQERG